MDAACKAALEYTPKSTPPAAPPTAVGLTGNNLRGGDPNGVPPGVTNSGLALLPDTPASASLVASITAEIPRARLPSPTSAPLLSAPGCADTDKIFLFAFVAPLPFPTAGLVDGLLPNLAALCALVEGDAGGL